MTEYKNKHLRVQDQSGKVVRRIDVSHLNKEAREAEWDKIDAEYPRPEFRSCYETTQSPLPVV